MDFIKGEVRRKIYREVYRGSFENLIEGKHYAFYVGDIQVPGLESVAMLFSYNSLTNHFHLVSDSEFKYHAEAVLEDEEVFILLEVIE